MGSINLKKETTPSTPASGYTKIAAKDDDSVVYVTDGGTTKTITPSPLTTKGDVWTYSTADARLGVGSNGQVLTADSTEATGVKWATPASGVTDHTLLTNIGTNTHAQIDSHLALTDEHIDWTAADAGVIDESNFPDPSTYWYFHAPYINGSTAITPYVQSASGTGAACVANTSNLTAGRGPSTLICTTGSTSTGYASGSLAGFKIAADTLGSFGALFRNLSDATDEYIIRVGFISSKTSAAVTNGIWFEYNRLTSTNWLICSNGGSGPTQTDSGIAASASTWYDLKFRFNAAGTSISYWINGTSAGSVTTNLPDSTTIVYPCFLIVKSAGTNARILDFDYCYGRGAK